MGDNLNEKVLQDISKKLSVLIALSLRHLVGDTDLSPTARRKMGVQIMVHYLADLGLDAREIASIVGSPLASVHTLLTPTRRK